MHAYNNNNNKFDGLFDGLIKIRFRFVCNDATEREHDCHGPWARLDASHGGEHRLTADEPRSVAALAQSPGA